MIPRGTAQPKVRRRGEKTKKEKSRKKLPRLPRLHHQVSFFISNTSNAT
jgi:hypothetical protein